MKLKLRTNLVSGIAASVFAVLLWFISYIQVVDVSNKMIKADFLPRLIAVIIFACGIWLIADSIRHPEKDKEKEIDLKQESRVLIYMAVLVAYVALFEKIGFMLDSLMLALFTLVFVHDKKTLHYVIVAIYVTAIFFIFKYALGIPFPTLFLK